MSINNINPGPVPLSQIAHPATGQIYMISNQHPFYFHYPPRPYLDPSHAMQVPQAIHHRMIAQQPAQQPQLQPPPQQPSNNSNNHQQQTQLQLPAPPPKRVPVQPPAQSKDQTNSKIKNIKEKCITHYIDGQLIIETPKPLAEKKLKSAKKKKMHSNNQHQDNGNNNNNNNHTINSNTNNLQNHHQPQQIHIPQQIQIQQPQQQLLPLPPPPQIQTQPIQVRHSMPTQIQPISQPIAQALPQPSPKPQILPPPIQQPIQVPQQQQTPPPKPAQKQGQQSNSQNIGTNEVQRLRAEMKNWSVREVVEFIERHEDIRQYSSKFSEDEVDGKALLLMIDRSSIFQILTSMFKNGPAIKIEATLSKYKIND